MNVHLEIVLSRKLVVFPCPIKNNYYGSCIRWDLLFNTKQRPKQSDLKMGRGSKQIFFQRRQTDDQHTRNMFNIIIIREM